jgi:hypothetical protein
MVAKNHYRNPIIRRVPGAHGEDSITHGKVFAVGRTRRTPDGEHFFAVFQTSGTRRTPSPCVLAAHGEIKWADGRQPAAVALMASSPCTWGRSTRKRTASSPCAWGCGTRQRLVTSACAWPSAHGEVTMSTVQMASSPCAAPFGTRRSGHKFSVFLFFHLNAPTQIKSHRYIYIYITASIPAIYRVHKHN